MLTPKATGKVKAGGRRRGRRRQIIPLPWPTESQVWLFRERSELFQTCAVCPHPAGLG